MKIRPRINAATTLPSWSNIDEPPLIHQEVSEAIIGSAMTVLNQLIGALVPDLLVDDLVIADPKVVTTFNDAHIAQMIGYLNITSLKLALLLNFRKARLEWKRVAR